jgi:predicted permease
LLPNGFEEVGIMKPEATTFGSGVWAGRIFSAFLRSYPPSFRAEYGPAMMETFAAKLADTGRGMGSRALFLVRECSGAWAGGIVLRVRELRNGIGGKKTAGHPVRFREASAFRRGRDLFPDLGQDLRQAVRTLGRRPGVTAGGALALGLGIGLTTLMFCVIYGAAFRPLPVPDGDRIVHMEHVDPPRGLESLGISLHDLADWRDQQSSFEDLGGFYTGSFYLTGGDRPERLFGGWVTANTFEILRIPPLAGRSFVPTDGRPGAPLVVVISHGVWESRFGGEEDVVGRTVRVNGESATVVGIMPNGLGFPYWQDVWIPIREDHLAVARGEGPGLEVFGRLRDGVSLDQARTEFTEISARLAREYPESNEGRQALLEPYTLSYLGPEAGAGFLVLFLAVAGVLLVACFNVANLLLAQAVTRIRDLAIRVAVGAGRRRVISKVLQEALILAAVGAVLGTGLAVLGVHIINREILATATFPPPFWMVFKVDAPILAFVVVVTGLAALVSGVLPAWKASRTDVHSLLQDNSRGGVSIRMGRLSRLMVTAELIVSAALLVASGHMAADVARAQDVQYAYPVDDVLTARVGLFEGFFPTRESRSAFYEDLQTQLEERPEVVSVALASSLPGEEAGRYGFSIRGQDFGSEEDLPRARFARVSAGFFRAMDVQVLNGREFSRDDVADAPLVAVVNESFTRRYLRDVDPIGAQVRAGGPEEDGPWLTVVGVVPDLNLDGALDPAGAPEGIYRPVAQGDIRFVSIAVRTRGNPLTAVSGLRDEVLGLQPDTPIFFARTLRDAINNNLLNYILISGLLLAFGISAFLMASVGLYAVTSFLASRRTRELGLRMALGAEAGDLLGLVLKRGLFQVVVGLTLGLLLAAAARELSDGVGVEVSPWSLPVTLSVCLALGGTGLWAVVAPARRATRVDPMVALREE